MKRTLLPLLGMGLFATVSVSCGDDETNATGTTGGGGEGNVGNVGNVGGQGAGPAGGNGGVGGGGGDGGSTPCVNTMPPDTEIPANLSETGLYSNIADKTIMAPIQEFEPQYPLWSDGAAKTRWVYLPECEQIDTTNMDYWDFPIGTRFWKEFRVGGNRIETRMLSRIGPEKTDWLMAAYHWDPEEAEAVHIPGGLDNASGTTHQIPSETQCLMCHGGGGAGGTPSRVLGFGALQLSVDGPISLSGLIGQDKLTDPPAGPFVIPGNVIEQAALGYLHANCGNCHNDTTDGVVFVSMQLHLKTAELLDGDVTQTSTYLTTVDVDTSVFGAVPKRIDPGNIAGSAVHFRMNTRGTGQQMPPLGTGGTKVVDPTGVGAIEDWICNLDPSGCP